MSIFTRYLKYSCSFLILLSKEVLHFAFNLFESMVDFAQSERNLVHGPQLASKYFLQRQPFDIIRANPQPKIDITSVFHICSQQKLKKITHV